MNLFHRLGAALRALLGGRIDIESFTRKAHARLLTEPGLLERLQKTSWIPREAVERYRVGVVTGYRPAGLDERVTAWVLPITAPDGRLLAVRLHEIAKSSQKRRWWLTEAQPLTFWPPVEQWRGAERLYVAMHEAGALAMIGAGLKATAVTGDAEGFDIPLPEHLVERLRDAGAAEIILVGGDPENRWERRAEKMLRSAGFLPTLIASLNLSDSPTFKAAAAARSENA